MRRCAARPDYDLVRRFLASGLVVANTFYGPVSFDAFGQNEVPTTIQVSDGGAAELVLSDPSIFDATRLSDDVTLAFAPFLYPSTGALALVAPGRRWPDVFSIEWSDADRLLCAPGICDGDAPRLPLAPPLPPPPPSPPPDFTAPITIGVVGAVAVVILLLSLWRWQYKKRKRAVRHAVQNEEETARVREAVAATATLTHAAAPVRASTLSSSASCRRTKTCATAAPSCTKTTSTRWRTRRSRTSFSRTSGRAGSSPTRRASSTPRW